MITITAQRVFIALSMLFGQQSPWSLFYSEKERHRPPLSRQKEFRQIKNAVIQEAETIRLGEITFEDDALDLRQSDEVDKDEDVSWDFWTLRMDVQDECSSLAERDDAVESMRKLAESGDVHAQYFMGKLYLDGSLVIPDSEVAMNWFHKASTGGYAPAQYALGKLLLSDDANVHDSEAGIQWLEHVAYNGNHYASYRLGKEYLKGESVRRDTRKAMDHIYTSAQAGNPHAQYLLGKLLLQGKVVERDKEEGIQWLTQAAEQGHGYAQCLLERQSASTAPEVFLAVTRLLHHMANIFQDNSLPQSGTGLMQVLTPEEMQRLLIQAKEDGCYELLLLELSTGLRRGEILALQWDDLNFNTGALRVERQVHRVKGELVGLSQILCKRRNAVQIEQNLFKAEVAQAAAALFSK